VGDAPDVVVRRGRRLPLPRARSQRLLGTQEIVLIHHADCGMLTFTDEEFAKTLAGETGCVASSSTSRRAGSARSPDR
jgi:carbonic anhydrase